MCRTCHTTWLGHDPATLPEHLLAEYRAAEGIPLAHVFKCGCGAAFASNDALDDHVFEEDIK